MNVSATKPGIIIVSSSNTKPKSLIKLMTHGLPVENINDQNIVSEDWEIKTKYYTANVTIHGITEAYARTDDFNSSIEALIIHMDSNKESGLTDLEKWTQIENDCNMEVKLLVSNYFTQDTKISKMEATKWCLKRGFELIELYPSTDNCTEEPEEDDIIKEKTGVERIIEALQAHVWSNLVMNSANNDNENLSHPESDSSTFENSLNDFITNDGLDDFTELFSQLNMFKESLTSMSSSQRKQNAEQLVTKFWEAIGGDEEELSDV